MLQNEILNMSPQQSSPNIDTKAISKQKNASETTCKTKNPNTTDLEATVGKGYQENSPAKPNWKIELENNKH